MCCHHSDHDKMIMHIPAGCTADLTQLLSRPLMSFAMQGTLEHRPTAVPLSDDVSHRSKQLGLSSWGACLQCHATCHMCVLQTETAKAQRRLLSNVCCELLLRHCHPSFLATMTHNMLIQVLVLPEKPHLQHSYVLVLIQSDDLSRVFSATHKRHLDVTGICYNMVVSYYMACRGITQT